GSVSPTTAGHVRESFAGSDVMVLDGGPCRAGIESTVVALAPRPRIIRRGLISADEIAAVLGRDVEDAPPAHADPGRPQESPGQMARHYAPHSATRLFEPTAWRETVRAAGV